MKKNTRIASHLATQHQKKRFGVLLLFLRPRTHKKKQQPHLFEMMLNQNKEFLSLIKSESEEKVKSSVEVSQAVFEFSTLIGTRE